jgi:hypothetical protein
MLEHGRGTIRLEDVEAARDVVEGEDRPDEAPDADALERPAMAD